MFQPETEDMLPRMAPKPSASSNEHAVKPQVPEISILFGQQEGNLQQQQNVQLAQQPTKNNTQQTYAAWKKQMLPKVTYTAPAAGTGQDSHLPENSNNNNNVAHNYNMPRSNLYPLRRTTTPPLTMTAGGTQSNGFGITNGGVTNPPSYRRSLENCNNNLLYQQYHQHLQPQSPQQVLLVTPTSGQVSEKSTRDILTICAGTQTDALSVSSNTDMQFFNLASKQDIDNVLQQLQDMRHEQLRIVKMLETILFYPPTATKPEARDVSTQVDIKEKENNPIVANGCGFQDLADQQIPTNKFIQHLKPSPNNILQSPKGKPMAQSTTYRPSSPQRIQEVALAAPIYQPPPNIPHTLTKSASDTSLAMNELALKYLPNEKLAKLLNELNMDRPLAPSTQNLRTDSVVAKTNNPSTPVRGNAENFERSSTDISNASYKYLKKYRLLPEDHTDKQDVDNDENENQHLPQYNTPHRPTHPQQYDNPRNSPINHRQTPPAKCSPYADGRLPLSPLARASPSSTPQHLVDLENIKHQPKFL